jgi:hypothetical protein
MERLDFYLYTYLEINKAVFAGAKMYFYEYKTKTLKNSFQSPDGYADHPTPVIGNRFGKFPKIFIDRPYSVSIRNRSVSNPNRLDVEIFYDDIE